MRVALCLLLLAITLPCSFSQEVSLPPGITKEKAAEGWIALFDGETTYGWKAVGEVKLENGIVTIGGDKEAHLTTTSQFSAFELVIHFRLENDQGGFRVTSSSGPMMYSSEDKRSKGYTDFSITLPSSSKTAPIGITTTAGTTLHIKSITLKPLGTKPIFNGTDLTGWKEIPSHKSKFSVTSKGELNVKDGNGDLQSLDQWDDFVLQVDVISNGDHLNSGVFFRCLPGEFWSGYEAQVRNEWQSTVKLKDGKSHTGSLTTKGDQIELKVGRQTMKFAKSDIESITDLRNKPIDFGSGGLYHFCPARKVVSTDREYYTMTVVANGNHFAIWVNGYQTAEHTDNRPFNKSARQGRRDDKGTISIQGHDPTTDLNFKNFRIVGLGK